MKNDFYWPCLCAVLNGNDINSLCFWSHGDKISLYFQLLTSQVPLCQVGRFQVPEWKSFCHPNLFFFFFHWYHHTSSSTMYMEKLLSSALSEMSFSMSSPLPLYTYSATAVNQDDPEVKKVA